MEKRKRHNAFWCFSPPCGCRFENRRLRVSGRISFWTYDFDGFGEHTQFKIPQNIGKSQPKSEVDCRGPSPMFHS